MVVTSRTNIAYKKEENHNNAHKKKTSERVAQALLEYKKHMVNEVHYKEIKDRGLVLENKKSYIE